MDAAEYKHVVLGLIFLKYISDSFYDLYYKLKEGKGEYEGADPDDPYEYRAENVFYVPPQARWDYLQSRAKLPRCCRKLGRRCCRCQSGSNGRSCHWNCDMPWIRNRNWRICRRISWRYSRSTGRQSSRGGNSKGCIQIEEVI